MRIPDIDFHPAASKVEQIVQALNDAIDQGLLAPASKLPSAREMTEHWCVSKFTLIEALDRLRSQGRITSSQGLGYFVATQPAPRSRATGLDLLPQDLTSVLRRSLIGTSSAMRPGSGHLPESWLESGPLRASLRQASRSPHLRLAGYGDPQGYMPLRVALQQKLLSQGLDVSVEQIITTANTVQALDMLLRLRVRRGDCVLLDSPCYFNFHANLALQGVRVVTLERTHQGLDLKALEKTFIEQRPVLYLTTSILHNPTGHSFSPGQAYGVLELAKRYNCHVIEDDLYGDLHPNPPPRLAALAGLEQVTYLSGFSKTLSANLRVSYVVAAPQLAANLTQMKLMCGGITSELFEQVLCSIHNDGSYHKHRKRIVQGLLASGARVAGELQRLGFTLHGTYEGGLFIWATLPAGIDAQTLAQQALKHDVVLAPGTLFGFTPELRHAMRMNVAHSDTARVMAALERLLV